MWTEVSTKMNHGNWKYHQSLHHVERDTHHNSHTPLTPEEEDKCIKIKSEVRKRACTCWQQVGCGQLKRLSDTSKWKTEHTHDGMSPDVKKKECEKEWGSLIGFKGPVKRLVTRYLKNSEENILSYSWLKKGEGILTVTLMKRAFQAHRFYQSKSWNSDY